LEDPSASAVVPAASPGPQAPVVTSSPVGPCLEEPSTASATADSPAREVRPAEPTAISSAVTLAEPTVAPSAVASSSGGAVHTASASIVHPSERMHPREPIVPSLAIATSSSGQVWLFLRNYFGLLPRCLAYPLFLQNLDLSELLAFDPATIGSTILEADDPPSGHQAAHLGGEGSHCGFQAGGGSFDCRAEDGLGRAEQLEQTSGAGGGRRR
jgi:hypothetical protein